MAITPKILDPVKGLIDYTQTIKPYHSKIIEVLEEYIHTDFLNVTMSDDISLCINVGYPNLNTLFAYNIIGLNTNYISVNTNVLNRVNIGQRIYIEFSTYNDGFYYVTDVQYDILSNTSKIYVNKSLNSSIIDGQIVNSVIKYCPFDTNKSTNVLELPEIICEDGYGEIYDSFLNIVLQTDTINNHFVIFGNHLDILETTTTVSLINPNLAPNDIIGTFHINSVSYNGSETIISVIEPILSFPNFNINDSYSLLITYKKYDTSILCNLQNDPNSSETLYVSMKEDFSLEIGFSLEDSFKVYNMENSYQSGFDNINFTSIISSTQPNIPETVIAPNNPNFLDLWFDTSTQILKQWNNLKWKSINTAYWYQENPLNNQIATHYKIVKNKFVDTGWFEIDPTLNDKISIGYDLENYSTISHYYYHTNENVIIDQSLNGLFLTGGNYIPFLNNNNIQTYNETSPLGIINNTFFQIDSINNNDIIMSPLNGDLSNIFVNGVSFIIENPLFKNKYFNVISSVYNGTNTIITVSEDLSLYDFNVNIVNGIIPGILYIQPNTLGSLNQISTLFISDNNIDPSIKMLDYYYNGPLQLSIDMFNSDSFETSYLESGFSNELFISPNNSISGDIAGTTITEDIQWSWGNIIDWFQYFILNYPSLTEVIVAGNATSDIQIGQEFRIFNSENAGIYSVNSIIFTGINTIITINETFNVDNISSGFIEPVDILQIKLYFTDSLQSSFEEDEVGGLLDTSGNIVESFDFKYFDLMPYQ